MSNQLLHKKQMLRHTPLFDESFVVEKYCDEDRHDDISVEVTYLNERHMWKYGTSGLFNGAYYQNGYGDLINLSYPAIIHYITNGYFEARRPSSLVDIDFIVEQIIDSSLPLNAVESQEVKVKVLAEYPGIFELLESTNVNPNRLFDNQYYLEQNEFEAGEIEEIYKNVPLLHFYRNGGVNLNTKKFLETSPLFCMADYLVENRDVSEAPVNPLEHLLTHGLREKRLSCFKNVFNTEFLRNTADLYNDTSFENHEKFIQLSSTSGQLGGPSWNSKYKEEKLPSLALDEANYKGATVTVGSVLYDNSDEELECLILSINREIARCAEFDIKLVYSFFVNDIENIGRYTKYIEADKLHSAPEGNIGFGAAHNELMERAFSESEYYFGINPDGYILRNCVLNLVNFTAYYDNAVLVEANTMPVGHPKWFDPIKLDTKWVSGVAFFLSKRLWVDVKGFDSDIHMYCEDVDFSWRVRAAGYGLKICPTASFFHDVTPRFSDEQKKSEEGRRKEMLLGAYYLCKKWRAEEQAEEYYQTLVSENLLLPNATPLNPKKIMPKSIAKQVSDFKFGLRFAPSRYW